MSRIAEIKVTMELLAQQMFSFGPDGLTWDNKLPVMTMN